MPVPLPRLTLRIFTNGLCTGQSGRPSDLHCSKNGCRSRNVLPSTSEANSLVQEQAPLLAEQFRQLVRHSELIHSRLDVLSRFVLVMRGIAKDSSDGIAAELGVSRTAVVQAYRLAVDLIRLSPLGESRLRPCCAGGSAMSRTSEGKRKRKSGLNSDSRRFRRQWATEDRQERVRGRNLQVAG